jgi:formylglycine-generating enzyme required for sulfatase activity/curved DNA-binding protein CbpA
MEHEHDYYRILNVPRDATDADIRRAFRSLAKEHHPDRRQNGSGEPSGYDFGLLTEAYETLKDPERRAAYDEELNQARQLSAADGQRGKRPFAFAAGLAVGVIMALVAVGGVTFLSHWGGKSRDKAQDSLTTAVQPEPIKTAGKGPVAIHENASETAADSPSTSVPTAIVSQTDALSTTPRSDPPGPSPIDKPSEALTDSQTSPLPVEPAVKLDDRPLSRAPGQKDLVEVSAGPPGSERTLRLEPGRGLTEGFTDCPSCPDMVVIPSGQMVMGSRPESDGYRPEEAPAHRILVRKPVAISKHVISAGNWRACVDAGVCRLTLSSLLAVGPRVAATRVTWFDAKAYVEWLSQTTGRRYRLLTEAEWEYAARARKAAIEPEGARERRTLDKDMSAPFPAVRFDRFNGAGPNAWGIYGGGVLEWVEDCWHGSYEQAPNDTSPWLSAFGGDCAYRVVRGSTKSGGGFGWRASARAREFADISAPALGFRVARDIATPEKTALGQN